MDLLLVLAAALVAGTVGGVVGTGSSMVLMPILVVAHGPAQAVPIMAIAAFLGNLGRVLAWRRALDLRLAGAFCATAVPGAVLGVRSLLALPAGLAEAALGLFFLALVPVRRLLAGRVLHLRPAQLALLGAPLGFLTGIVVSTGPLTVPLFQGAGLQGGAMLGTEALASLAVYAAKVGTFRGLDALPAEVVAQGLAAGAALMAGSFAGRALVLRLPPAAWRLLIDAMLVASGGSLLWVAVR